jgi:hypothetical protein
MLYERCLEGMEIVGAAKPFDRQDVIILMHHRKRETGIDPPAVHQHGARAALAMVAALLGAGQREMLAELIVKCIGIAPPGFGVTRSGWMVSGR